MKKLLILLFLFLFSLPADAVVIDSTKDGNIEKQINKIGFKILNCNRIPYRITFFYKNNSNVINAYSSTKDRKIVIYKGIITIADNEDELAAIIAHEISHSVDSSEGLWKGFFAGIKYWLTPKKYELKADKRAVDYMISAGYNPLAIMTVYSKIMAEPRYDFLSSHPLSSKRMMYVYEYIYNKYPAILANNKYEDNIYYQNFLLTSEKNRKKLQNKIETNSKKKVKYE